MAAAVDGGGTNGVPLIYVRRSTVRFVLQYLGLWPWA